MRAAPHFLLIADNDRSLQSLISDAMPAAQLRSVPTYFDAIAELGSSTSPSQYSAILANAEPIERRPEAAVKTLRDLAGNGRLILFGHPTLEPLQRKMLEFGCDDYLVTPAPKSEIAELLSLPGPRLQRDEPTPPPHHPDTPLLHLPLTDIVLESLVDAPHNAPAEVIRRLNTQLPPSVSLDFVPPGASAPTAHEGAILLSLPLKSTDADIGTLYMSQPATNDEELAKALLAQLAPQIIRLVALQDRHNRLQKLAITDELTGLYNGRYFKHYLAGILARAKHHCFEVSLLLFDIDDFKKYNDRFGHGAGDDILKQTATLMRRCCRDHDLVARISGDEFAVIFWEKDPPRQPKDAASPVSTRMPTDPSIVFDRFRKQLASHMFECLGPTGKGTLTVSAGIAKFPWDAQSPEKLIEAADTRLMFGAKKSGKNSCHLVGPDQPKP
jgi:diguanylate cyclase (GGDEF)-like protein